VGSNSSGSPPNTTTQVEPFLGGVGQSSGNMIQITILTVDVALKLTFNEENKIRPWVVPIGWTSM
jgi:hypothetical protein